MKVLIVNHGYPMQFNAGSEIYTRNLVHGLLRLGIQLRVFSRSENPFFPDYKIFTEIRETEHGEKYQLDLINVPRQKDRYQSDGIDLKFKCILNEFEPDIVHFNHLNHLSLGMIEVTHKKGIKIVFTLHDFWLACPRGQFVQINYGETTFNRLCDGQENRRCASHCYSRYYTGLANYASEDINYWEKWVGQRQIKIREIIEIVDLFIAPSPTIKSRMIKELHISNNKIVLLDYGFNLDNFRGRNRIRDKEIIFGYIGTHTVPKGIHHLLQAFSELRGQTRLLIFGRPRSEITPYLPSFHTSNSVEWLDEYENSEIVQKVFNQIDVIVVPSIWLENSPLVIHEAQQARIPVITANYGGMADYVQHNVNGLLFEHRNIKSLTSKMQQFIDDPDLIDTLGQRGYLFSDNGNIPSLEEHCSEIIKNYKEVMS